MDVFKDKLKSIEMFKFIVACALFAVAFGSPKSRIIGGWDVDYHNSGVVSIRSSSGDHICSGSIVNENWVLTAAHCVFGTTTPVSLVAGTSTLNAGGVTTNVIDKVIHQDFNPYTYENDIALIKVETPFVFGESDDGTRIYSLIFEGIPVTEMDITGWVYGWGSTTGNADDQAKELQIVKMKTVQNDVCAEAWGQVEIFDTMLCALGQEGEGVCYGDAGGPLIHSKAKVVGFVSFWPEPCANGTPDVYTRIEPYLGWIESVIGEQLP